MFKFYKEYIKWKLRSQIKDRLLELSVGMTHYSLRQQEWEIKKYDASQKIPEVKFEQIRKEQISFSNDEWKRHHQQYKAIESTLGIINDL